eukprot:scaffold75235_cov23-Cyclotella_meneghiniana.AAC.2
MSSGIHHLDNTNASHHRPLLCNGLCYPKLKASPTFGDAMRYHAEYPVGTGGIHCYGDEFRDYLSDGTLRVDVDWGSRHLELCRILQSCTTQDNTVVTS